MMQIFNGTVRLAGELGNEVSKRGLTVTEILVLRRIHGEDSVINIKSVGLAEVDPIEERERLDFIYGNGLAHLHEDQKTSIEKMFGGDYNPLPQELRDYDGEIVDEEKDLEEFQAHDGFVSPNIEDRATQIRNKAALKKAKKKDAVKTVAPVRSAKKALDAVL